MAASPQANGIKRKTSLAGLLTGGRNIKRRASKACSCCRSRKVRCDVTESGIPCTNCRLDEVECLVTEGKRRRKSYAELDLLNLSPPTSIGEREDLPAFPILEDIDGLEYFVSAKEADPGRPTTATLEHELSHHTPHMIYQTQGHKLSNEERQRRLSIIRQTNGPLIPIEMPAAPRTRSTYSSTSFKEIVLPKYITQISPRLMREDLDYLRRKGAFFIPDTAFRNELLRTYVQYVHPYAPVIDLEDFLGKIEENNTGGTVSLLLFQAVMFAATAYVDMRYLTTHGYETRKAARKAFFQRAKLLYDLDLELDRVTVVQSVMLMTYWYENPDDPKDVWHWLGVAVSLARTIGINCSTEQSPMPLQTRRLWKRIWWSLYIRDRLVAIGMRRPFRIRDEEFDVSLLTLDDFNTESLPQNLCRIVGNCPAVKDSSKRKTLANLCVEMANLCKCITNVLRVQYAMLGHKLGLTQETTMRLVPRKSAAAAEDVRECGEELENWYDSLPKELRYFTRDTHEKCNTNDGEVIHVHRSLLSGVYMTALSALHRPQVIPTVPSVPADLELLELSTKKIREAANDITEIYKDLYGHDLIRYMPNTGVTVILPAIIVHLLDIKSADRAVSQLSFKKFQFCMQALQRLREMYASADFAFSFLDCAVQRANVPAGTDHARPTTVIKMTQPQPTDAATLTPPPDFLQQANDQATATLAEQEQILLSALTTTPPSSEKSLASNTTGGAAVSLLDLNSFDQDEQQQEYNAEQDHVYNMTANDFDQLINLEGGADLFAPDDGFDVNMDLNVDQLKNDTPMEDYISGNHTEDCSQPADAGLERISGEYVACA